MREKILCFCQEQGLLQGEMLLLAVSGGRDSMAMLHFFQTMEKHCQLAVGHFDHQSRQGASTGDARFVETYAKEGNLPYYEGTAPVQARAKAEKLGFEAMARQLRYDFLLETADKIKASWILTAHQAEDNVETFLLHFCRGTGLGGLSGIAPVKGKIVRPMLSVTREEISRYVAENGVLFVEDSSNAEEKYRRNFVRHQILPKLDEVNPQYLPHSMNTMSIIRDENNFLDEYVQGLAPLSQVDGFRVVAKADFMQIPEALRLRWVGYFAGDSPCYPRREELLGKIMGDNYGGNLLYEVKTGEILRDFPMDIPKSKELFPDSQVVWGKWHISVGVDACCHSPPKQCFYVKKTSGLWVGSRQEGDKIAVAGRAHYSLKKYLQQEKIPPWMRDFLPIFRDKAGNMVAVGHLAVDTGFLPLVGEESWKIKLSLGGENKEKKETRM